MPDYRHSGEILDPQPPIGALGLAVQHLVDPDEAPVEDYVPLFDLLIGRLVETDTK
jgi:hypothetical protein